MQLTSCVGSLDLLAMVRYRESGKRAAYAAGREGGRERVREGGTCTCVHV